MSEPTPPGVPAPPAPEPATDDAGREAPIEVKRARTLYTATAAFLVFIGVTGLIMLKDAERALRKQLNEIDDPEVSKMLDPSLIWPMLIMVGVAVIVIAIGHGVTAQALHDRKSWARPVGFTFSGILLAFAVLGSFTGALSIQTIFFMVAGLSGILTLAKPQVRDWLEPFPKRDRGPGPFPPYGPGGPPTGSGQWTSGSGQWPQPGPPPPIPPQQQPPQAGATPVAPPQSQPAPPTDDNRPGENRPSENRPS